MGKKSKRKNKGKKGNKPPVKKPPPTPPPPQLPPENPSSGPKPSPNNGRTGQFWKRIGSVLAIAVGLLTVIQFRPRPTPGATPPTGLDELASSRFTITNEGYIKFTDVKAVCFLWDVRFRMNPSSLTNSLENIISPPESILETGETLTVPCTLANPIHHTSGVPFQLRKADLAIVVYYRPWPFTL